VWELVWEKFPKYAKIAQNKKKCKNWIFSDIKIIESFEEVRKLLGSFFESVGRRFESCRAYQKKLMG